MRNHLGLVLGLADFFQGPFGPLDLPFLYGEPCHTASMLNSLAGPAKRAQRSF